MKFLSLLALALSFNAEARYLVHINVKDSSHKSNPDNYKIIVNENQKISINYNGSTYSKAHTDLNSLKKGNDVLPYKLEFVITPKTNKLVVIDTDIFKKKGDKEYLVTHGSLSTPLENEAFISKSNGRENISVSFKVIDPSKI